MGIAEKLIVKVDPKSGDALQSLGNQRFKAQTSPVFRNQFSIAR